MTEEIRITDLANPQLTDMQQQILSMGEGMEVSLDANDIISEASKELGLNDFGDMEFMQRLVLLCKEWDAHADMNSLGKMHLRSKLLTFAKTRLLIQNLLNRHPEIHRVEIRKPIIVAGLPRSGTTHLLNLMAADSRLRALPLWESYEPLPVPGEKDLPDGTDPRYQRCADAWGMMQAMVPHLAAMHPMNPDHIHEELELMGPDFASYNFEWLCHSPRWRDHYYTTDQTPHYQYMKTVLKILTWQDGDSTGENTRWVLKCPQHLEQLPVLHEVFPDATIPVTHRDPVSVIQSACTMLAYGHRMSRKRVDTGELIAYWSDRVIHLLEACVKDRDKIPQSQSLDVLFHEFMQDDIGMVEEIYARASLPMTDQARTELEQFMATHQRGQQGRVTYNLKEDFGISPQQLRQRFKFYFDAFPVEVED